MKLNIGKRQLVGGMRIILRCDLTWLAIWHVFCGVGFWVNIVTCGWAKQYK
jgi:hypothetical protein